LGRDHALGDQQALSALIQFSQEERYLLDEAVREMTARCYHDVTRFTTNAFEKAKLGQTL
jgi:hypothetical protein